jgi:hypothetical protein
MHESDFGTIKELWKRTRELRLGLLESQEELRTTFALTVAVYVAPAWTRLCALERRLEKIEDDALVELTKLSARVEHLEAQMKAMTKRERKAKHSPPAQSIEDAIREATEAELSSKPFVSRVLKVGK